MNLKSPATWSILGTAIAVCFGGSLLAADKIDMATHWLEIGGGIGGCLVAFCGAALVILRRLKAGGSVTPGDIDLGGKP